MFYHDSASYRPSEGAERTQFNTLCSSFITCSISSDFIGGLEYWPESNPCPSLALAGRTTATITAFCHTGSFSSLFVSVLKLLFICIECYININVQFFLTVCMLHVAFLSLVFVTFSFNICIS